jgi:hypothetical protein
MDSLRRETLSRVLIVGVVYFLVGFVLSLFDRGRFSWRLAAWVISGVVFALHFGYEQFRIHNTPLRTALCAAAAVAIGGFLLAVAATVHAVIAPARPPFWLFLLALVLWPILTGLPAFVVALITSWLLSCLPAKRLADTIRP